jgi:hypothetical protein
LQRDLGIRKCNSRSSVSNIEGLMEFIFFLPLFLDLNQWSLQIKAQFLLSAKKRSK